MASTAKAAGARRPTNTDPAQHLLRVIQSLRHGLPRQQQSYSEAAAEKVYELLEATCSDLTAYLNQTQGLHTQGHGKLLGQVLQLMNRCWQWLLPTTTLQQAASVPASSSGDSSRPDSMAKRFRVMDVSAPLLEANMLLCMMSYTVIIASTDAQAPAAVRPYLLSEGTGTLCLLSRSVDFVTNRFAAAAAAAADDDDNDDLPFTLCGMFLSTWGAACKLAGADGSAAATAIWRQLPQLATDMPALLGLLHWYLQLPPSKRTIALRGSQFLQTVQQVQQLLELSAAPGDRLRSGGSTQRHGRAGQPQGAAARGKQAMPGVLVPPEQLFVRLSASTRTLIERFLWHALATAVQALQPHAGLKVTTGNNHLCPTSGTTGSSSSNNSNQVDDGSSSGGLCGGGAYPSFKLTWQQATDISCAAAAALLQLAANGSPQQQLPEAQAAAVWMHQQASVEVLATMAQLLAQKVLSLPADVLGRSQQQELAGAGYITWPRAGLEGPTIDASSSMLAATPKRGSVEGDAAGTVNMNARSSGSGTGSTATSALSTQTRLQVLAVACSAHTRHIDSWPSKPRQAVAPHAAYARGKVYMAQMQTLVLLIQQLQGAPAAVRSSFLHSPAGSAVLWVLSTLLRTPGQAPPYRGQLAVTGGPLGISGLQQDQHQQLAGTGYQLCRMTGPDMLQLLLLPGLLLQPVPFEQPGDTHAGSNDSSGSGDHSSNSSSGSGGGGGAALLGGLPGAGAPTFPIAGERIVVLSSAESLAMALVPHSALQLPPGCRPPPPAAFFLVEQLLRTEPSAAAMDLAVQLLRAGVQLLFTAGQLPHNEGVTVQQDSADVADRQAGSAELARLAYCSLASSVGQAAVHHPQLGQACEGALLELATDLFLAAGAAGESASMNSSNTGGCEVAAWVAIHLTAGAYTAHVLGSAAQTGAAHASTPSSPRAGTQGLTHAADVPSGAAAASSSSGSTAGAEATMVGCCPEGCTMCRAASVVLFWMRCMEGGLVLASTPPHPLMLAAHAEAAQRRGTTLQQHLQQQLLALAWRHPVPGVCGNVLCGQLQGPSAVGGVRNRMGTLCGGCRAAWYCCEECQRAAWEAHREMCGAAGST